SCTRLRCLMRGRCGAPSSYPRWGRAPPGRARPRRCGATCPATGRHRPISTPLDGGHTVRRAIRVHRANFIAIVALVLGSIVVSGYILLHQPAFTLLKDYYVVRVPFSTAAAVKAGQGQTVNIAGVPVGQVGGTSLDNGTAIVTMDIYKKYAPIYRNATVLLRPRTPLKDMFLALDPGSPSAGKVPNGGTLSVGATIPDVDFSQILSSLDTDTRDYLLLLLSGGAQAFQSNPNVEAANPTNVADLR